MLILVHLVASQPVERETTRRSRRSVATVALARQPAQWPSDMDHIDAAVLARQPASGLATWIM